MSIPITDSTLKAFGFEYENLHGQSPYHWYKKDGIRVWDMNGLYWLIHELDQGGLDVEFHTIEQLNAFWIAVGKDPLEPRNSITIDPRGELPTRQESTNNLDECWPQ